MNFNKERSVRMDAKKLLQQFGLQVSEAPQSIYPYSPVFKIGSVIVKRTQKKHDLTLFLEDLQRRAIAIVAPITIRGKKVALSGSITTGCGVYTKFCAL